MGLSIWLTLPLTIPQQDTLTQMGPRFFPGFVAGLLTVLGFLLAARELAGARLNKRKQDPPPATSEINEKRVFLFVVIMVLTGFVLQWTNYFVALSLCATCVLLLFRVKRLGHYFILGLFIAGMYFVFVKLMYVQL
jgi:hypothetical protein